MSPETTAPLWTIRDPFETDLPFVYSSWLNLLWDRLSHAWDLTKTEFFDSQIHSVDSILKDDSSRVAVACSPTDPVVIYGYAVFSTAAPCLYAVFVKSDFRKFGIGASLLNYSKGKQNHGKTQEAA